MNLKFLVCTKPLLLIGTVMDVETDKIRYIHLQWREKWWG